MTLLWQETKTPGQLKKCKYGAADCKYGSAATQEMTMTAQNMSLSGDRLHECLKLSKVHPQRLKNHLGIIC